jgi:Na+/H+ antiporter NhaD/arsenite permease-like protein
MGKAVKEKTDEKGGTVFLAHKDLVLERTVSPAFWIATLVLILIYGLIAFEVTHRTLAALLGAALMLFVSYTAGSFNSAYFILSYEDAVRAIDLNVIFLLMAMMMIVGIMKKTGLFQWLAFASYQVARGNVFVLSCILMVVTAFISAFLDNVTTMILIIPVTLNIAQVLKINPITLLLPEVFASNVGGTATLIGDPPNIMIGSYAKLTFLDFLIHLTLICLICLAVCAIYFLYWYKKDYMKPLVGNFQKTIEEMRVIYTIKDKTLLLQCSVVLGITIFLFIIHGALHMEPSIAAMTGAAVLLLVSRVKIVELLEHEIEWPTLIFFMMLFIIVAGAEETGLIQIIADWVNHISKGSLVAAILTIIWVSALASSIIDNIPFTATMLPIVAYLNDVVPGAQGGVLWWALALGACLGGNGTMIGASANVVTMGIAESQGYHVSFVQYFKIAFIPMIITIILASVWLLVVQI